MALRTRTIPLVPSASWKMALWNQPEAIGLQQTKPLVSEQFDLDAMNPSSPQRKELASLLGEFNDVPSSGPADLGRTGVIQHRIDTGDHPQWSRDCDLALRVLKEKLVSAPVLAFPCFVQNS